MLLYIKDNLKKEYFFLYLQIYFYLFIDHNIY
jgi:hypothetical protein